MPRPKRLRKCKSKAKITNGISMYAQYREGFNRCKEQYDKFIPDEKEVYGILLNNGIDELESKEIAEIISRRLK